MLLGITLKVYEYEYGTFKITCTCRNFWQIINTSSTMLSFIDAFFFQNPHYWYIQEHLTPSTSICVFACFFMIYQSCLKNNCHELLPNPRACRELMPCVKVFGSWWKGSPILFSYANLELIAKMLRLWCYTCPWVIDNNSTFVLLAHAEREKQ